MAKNTVVKSGITVTILILVSRILGFARESLIAAKFGATYATDIYIFSTGMVTLLFMTVGDGLGTTLVPMLTDYMENETVYERNRFINNIITIVGLIMIVLTVFGIVFSKYVVYIFAPGFINNPNTYINAVKILRITYISLVFISMQSVFRAVLQSHREFILPAYLDLLMNFIFIFYLIFLVDKYGLTGFALANVSAYLFQFMGNVPRFRALGYKYYFVLDFNEKGFRKMINLIIPVIIGTSVYQINVLIDRILATSVGEGSIAVLGFADKINMFVYSIFAMTILTIIYPSLSTYSAQNDLKKYKSALMKAINILLLVMVPASIGMCILRQPIVNILFKRGAFDTKAANLTAMVLLFLSPAMLLYGIRGLLNGAFYSIKDTRTPAINSIVGVSSNIILNLILVRYVGVVGLACGTSLSAIISTILLVTSINKKVNGIGLNNILKTFTKILIASTVMGVCVFILKYTWILKFGNGFKSYFNLIFISAVLGASVYGGVIYLLKVEECMYFINLIKNKFFREKVLG
jgi:putative peptidoglycan lipid II flippase